MSTTGPMARSGGTDAGGGRLYRSPETKEFFRTSEFIVWVIAVAAIFISAAIQDNFSAPQAWSFVTAVTAAYILSRGIAKAGSGRGD